MNKTRALLARLAQSRSAAQAAAFAFTVGAVAAHAEGADTSAITSAVATALAYAAAITAALIAVWGSKLAYRKFFGS